jgi:hypothetical protein
MNRHLTMAEVRDMPPLAALPMGDGDWSLVYPIAVSIELGAVAIGRVFDYVCSPQ